MPAIGYRTYRLAAGDDTSSADAAGWRALDGHAIENETYVARVDPGRGGTLVSLIDKRTDKEIVAPGPRPELLEYREYPNHPLFGEDRGT